MWHSVLSKVPGGVELGVWVEGHTHDCHPGNWSVHLLWNQAWQVISWSILGKHPWRFPKLTHIFLCLNRTKIMQTMCFKTECREDAHHGISQQCQNSQIMTSWNESGLVWQLGFGTSACVTYQSKHVKEVCWNDDQSWLPENTFNL